MMNRKEFYEYVKDNVKEYLPESYKDAEIKLQEVEKNNGLKLTGITIPNGDQRIVPTVYLDSLYQEYIHGKDVDSCVGDVADMRIEAQGKAEFFDMGVPDILDYEKMKNKLQVLWSSIFVTLMANKIGGLQFGIYRNCQISSRVFHTAVAALPLTKANRSDFE